MDGESDADSADGSDGSATAAPTATTRTPTATTKTPTATSKVKFTLSPYLQTATPVPNAVPTVSASQVESESDSGDASDATSEAGDSKSSDESGAGSTVAESAKDGSSSSSGGVTTSFTTSPATASPSASSSSSSSYKSDDGTIATDTASTGSGSSFPAATLAAAVGGVVAAVLIAAVFIYVRSTKSADDDDDDDPESSLQAQARVQSTAHGTYAANDITPSEYAAGGIAAGPLAGAYLNQGKQQNMYASSNYAQQQQYQQQDQYQQDQYQQQYQQQQYQQQAYQQQQYQYQPESYGSMPVVVPPQKSFEDEPVPAKAFHGNSIDYNDPNLDVLTPESEIALAHSHMSDMSSYLGASKASMRDSSFDFAASSTDTMDKFKQLQQMHPSLMQSKGENDVSGMASDCESDNSDGDSVFDMSIKPSESSVYTGGAAAYGPRSTLRPTMESIQSGGSDPSARASTEFDGTATNGSNESSRLDGYASSMASTTFDGYATGISDGRSTQFDDGRDSHYSEYSSKFSEFSRPSGGHGDDPRAFDSSVFSATGDDVEDFRESSFYRSTNASQF